METIWTKNYSPGVPAEINPDAYSSIVEFFLKVCKKYNDRPAFTNFGKTIQFSELEDLTQHVGAYLQNELKLKKGDKIAIILPNVLQFPIILFAALRLGLIVVNVNPLYTAREMQFQLNDSEAKVAFVLTSFASIIQEILPKTKIEFVITTQIGDLLSFPKNKLANFIVKYIKRMVPHYDLPKAIPFTTLISEGIDLTLKEPPLKGDDIAFLQYTGGTTGKPKGAILTHRNMIANIEQTSAWVAPFLEEGKEIIITALPLYHIFCLEVNCLMFLKFGGLNVLITNPRDINSFVSDIKKYPFSVITGVNTLFNALLNDDKFNSLNFSSLKISVGGGMAIQKTIAERWHTLTGVALLEGYGMTETSPVISMNPLSLKEYNGSIGLPMPSTQIKIVNQEGQTANIGEEGELFVRGPQVMQAYWHREEETKSILSPDGWLATGDIATIDEKGYIHLIDRKKDMICVSGFNVYPNEVEEFIAEHPGVLEIAVIGIPDSRSGEVVKALIVKKDANITERDIITHCRKGLTPYKIPKVIEFRDSLPKSNIGKILRKALKNEETIDQ